MPIERVVNWNKIITELNAAGVNNNMIAHALHKQFFAIKYWRDNDHVDPKFSDGWRLLKLHEKHVAVISSGVAD